MHLPPQLCLLVATILLFPSPSLSQSCSGDPTQGIQIGLSSCTALTSVSGGVSAGTTISSSTVEGSMTTQGMSDVTKSRTTLPKGPKTSMMGSGSTTVLAGTSTTPTVETVGGTSTSTSSSSTAGGAMITKGPLLLVGGAAALFAYGVM